MKFSLLSPDMLAAKTACLVIVANEGDLTGAAQAVDQAASGLISSLKESGDFAGKNGDTLLVPVTGDLNAQRLLLVGAGDKALNDQKFIKLMKGVAKKLIDMKVTDAVLCMDDVEVTGRDLAWKAQQASRLCVEASYIFNHFKSEKKPEPVLAEVSVAGSDATVENALATGAAIGMGVNQSRELGDLPGNVCDPSYMAEYGQKMADGKDNVNCTVLDEDQMRELGMGSLLSVSAGSENPGRLVVVEYNGGTEGDKPVVLVGKGVTFDTGGISLKPGQAMDEMKYDMGGAATVFGTLNAIIEMNMPVNVAGIVGAVENMPSGKATKPGDIVTAMNGTTIEVLNTDAEGRLVLCDCMTYAERYEPKAVIDIATLTGAIIVGLGHHPTAIYSNSDELSEQLIAAGKESADRGWPMPLWDEYDEELKSPFADLQNIGAGRAGGSITAACFLARFAKKYDWAHLDIAGTFWNSGANKGATGRPVPMLVEYLGNQAK